MSERQKLVHLHTSGTTEPSAAMLNLGEIAVQHASEESCLYIKNQDGELIKFIPSGTIQTMIDNISIDCGEYEGVKPKYLTFEAVSANSTVQLNKDGSGSGRKVNLQYSTDNGKTWKEYIFIEYSYSSTGQTITLSNIGDTVKFKGNNNIFSDRSSVYTFKMSGKIKATGNVTSLNNEIGCDIPMSNFCYYKLFYGCYNCTSLTTAPELPATNLAESCYSSMFNGCTSLTTAPELPATNLAKSCYNSMFRGCTSLTTAPELPATNLAIQCYFYMFYNCTSLTTAPELPATNLAESCYMFNGCTSLTTAPELPATNLAIECYSSMFNGCKKLSYIKALFLTSPSNTYTGNWVSGVASAGTFVKNSEATWTVTGVNAVPNGWTIETASS